MGWFEDLSASEQSQRSGIKVAPETALEQYANPMLQRGLQGMEGLVGAGPGEAQMRGGVSGTEDYANMLKGFMTPQGLFGMQQQGIDQYTKLGEQIFGGQMRQQQQEAQRLAGRLGRPVNDPILQAKLAQQRADTVGSFAAQQSLALPGQLAQFGGQRAEALQGLASQAMANRQALLGMGSNLREQDRAYRINTGERYSTQRQEGSFMSTLGGIAGIAGTVMTGIGGLQNAGNYKKLVDNEIAKGGTQGVLGGVLGGGGGGKSLLGTPSLGGSGGGGGGSFFGNMGAALGGGASLMKQLNPQQKMANVTFDSTNGMSNSQLSQSINASDPYLSQFNSLTLPGGRGLNYGQPMDNSLANLQNFRTNTISNNLPTNLLGTNPNYHTNFLGFPSPNP